MKIAAYAFVTDGRYWEEDDGALHSDGKVELFYKPIIAMFLVMFFVSIASAAISSPGRADGQVLHKYHTLACFIGSTADTSSRDRREFSWQASFCGNPMGPLRWRSDEQAIEDRLFFTQKIMHASRSMPRLPQRAGRNVSTTLRQPSVEFKL
jgi:hypothetical protein